MNSARWWRSLEGGRVLCELCPRGCRLADGDKGFCQVRRAEGHALVTDAYGVSSGFCVDPIEKKPLYHFHPGAQVLSFGTIGCNLGCSFCQNWPLSRGQARLHATRPEDIVRMALAQDCLGVAFTYNEPIVSAEFCLEVAAACREAGLAAVAVTSGYISDKARESFFDAMDAANVDLKGFTEAFYRDYCSARLGPVLETLEYLAQRKRTWVEVTTLVIPGANDGEAELEAQGQWMMERLGPGVPLHLSAFHPDYKLLDRPRTPLSTLQRVREIVEGQGLRYVYLGNVRDEDGGTTWCHACGRSLIEREGFEVSSLELWHGACPECGERLAGVFNT
ncbi:AmmeMemoRadiSam system radical SAM enzyme [Holophaga foetida]|uniref:AmmeMemoRadiSam system radical SAM enzyme n=1 Tax=Holophaga foetida TaxID=35839 RepID=UPI0002474D61|nr:AmmeMemoRadiSam system radical SAM enzyme [Holophaga foetida]